MDVVGEGAVFVHILATQMAFMLLNLCVRFKNSDSCETEWSCANSSYHPIGESSSYKIGFVEDA